MKVIVIHVDRPQQVVAKVNGGGKWKRAKVVVVEEAPWLWVFVYFGVEKSIHTYPSRVVQPVSQPQQYAWTPQRNSVFNSSSIQTKSSLLTNLRTLLQYLGFNSLSNGVSTQKLCFDSLPTFSLYPHSSLLHLLLSRWQLPHRLRLHPGLHRRQSPIHFRLVPFQISLAQLNSLCLTQKQQPFWCLSSYLPNSSSLHEAFGVRVWNQGQGDPHGTSSFPQP